MTRPRKYRYKKVDVGEYWVYLADPHTYLGTVTQDGTKAFPWVGEIIYPIHDDVPAVTKTRRVIGQTRDEIASILYRYWRDYPHLRSPDPRDGRRDDVPLPEPPDEWTRR